MTGAIFTGRGGGHWVDVPAKAALRMHVRADYSV